MENGHEMSAFSVYKRRPKIKMTKKSRLNRKTKSVPHIKGKKAKLVPPIKAKKTKIEQSVKKGKPCNLLTEASTNEFEVQTCQSSSILLVKNITSKRKVKCTTMPTDDDEIPVLVPITSPTDLMKTSKPELSKNYDNPAAEAENLFKWLISPMLPADFFAIFWEKEPLHIERKQPNYYKHVLSSAQLDNIFRKNLLHYGENVDVVVYTNGSKQVLNPYGRAVPSTLWDFYVNGCSIRLLNPQTYSNKVHILLATLQEYFGTMVGANVYLTPPDSQGFAPHYDDIEAFIIQLEGQKHWKLYKPKESEVLAMTSSPNFSRWDLTHPFLECTLKAGDMLYFPRGTIHEGRTSPDMHSLHITVSVYQKTAFANLLDHIIPIVFQNATHRDVKYRQGLPLNYLKDVGSVNRTKPSDCKNAIREKVKELISSLTDYLDDDIIDHAADQLGRNFMHNAMPPIPTKHEAGRCSKADGDHLKNGRVINRVEISEETNVRLLRYYCIRLVFEETGKPKLYYNTENANVYHGKEEQFLELEPSMVEVIQTLQHVYPKYVKIRDLPMADMVLKLRTISDLWEHGILVSEEPLENIDLFSDDDDDDDDDTK